MKVCRRFFISGKVQGVFYRANTQVQAKQLGLTGWVKNLRDKRVEVLACGDLEHIDRLHHWLKQGPPAANVTEVTVENAPYEVLTDFIAVS